MQTSTQTAGQEKARKEQTMAKKKPELTDLTPPQLRCCNSCGSCPAVFKDGATGDLIIVGATEELEGKVGPGETAIRINPALLANVIA